MTTVYNLVHTNANRKTLGNHRMERTTTGRNFIYHWTTICAVNDVDRTYHTDNGGWGTSSTTRAINAYKREFNSMGYTEV